MLATAESAMLSGHDNQDGLVTTTTLQSFSPDSKAFSPISSKRAATTVWDALDAWFEEAIGIEQSSFRTERHRLNCWTKIVGSDALPTDESIKRFKLDAKELGLAPKTINYIVKGVVRISRSVGHFVAPGRMFRVTVICKPVPQLSAIGKLYQQAPLIRFPIKLRTEKKWHHVAEDERAEWMRCMLTLGVYTGFRLGDLFGLTWSDVNEECITKRAHKTGKVHRIPMHPVVWDHLERLRPIFNRDRVLALSPANGRYALAEMKRLCGIAGVTPHITFHALRRASITTWAKTSPEAGRIIHGTGLGVLQHYYDQFEILKAYSDRFPFPDAMVPEHCKKQPTTSRQSREEVLSVLDKLDPNRLADVLRIAQALSEVTT